MARISTSQKRSAGPVAVRRERPLQRMQNLNTLFDRMWGNWLGPFERDFSSMRVWDFDVTENDKEITVRAELPGFFGAAFFARRQVQRKPRRFASPILKTI